MLKELEYWLKRAAAGLRSSALEALGGSGGTSLRRSADLIDFDTAHQGLLESEDE